MHKQVEVKDPQDVVMKNGIKACSIKVFKAANLLIADRSYAPPHDKQWCFSYEHGIV
jgi:hypothetical protein